LPFIAGGKPSFGQSEVGLRNVSDVVASRDSSGIILASAAVFVIDQPVFQLGDSGTTAPGTVALNADSGAKLLYDLARSKMVIGQATLIARNIAFHLVGPSPEILDFNGDELTDPQASISQLTIQVDLLGPVKVEVGELQGFSASAAKLSRLRKPGQKSGPSYSGHLSRPITIADVKAGQVSVDDKIFLSGLEISSLLIGLQDTDVDLGDGTKFSSATLDLSADSLKQVKIGDTSQNFYSNLRLVADGKLGMSTGGFSINGEVGAKLSLFTNGPETSLSGTGSLDIGSFTGSARSNLIVGFRCTDAPNLAVPVEYNFGMGGARAQARMKDGKVEADAGIGPMDGDMHTTGNAQCNSPSEKFVVAASASGWTNGICTQVWPPKAWPCRWEWSTPEVSFGYHIQLAVRFLNIAATMTNPHFYYHGGQSGVCNVGLLGVGATAIIGGYSPQIETPFGGDGQKLVNAFIAANFESAESLTASGIADGAGWLISSAATPLGNARCLGNPL
jgi:hypothetical protein